jgi:hypothetical protein
MGRPTLYSPGSLIPLNPKVSKDELDKYLPIHYILNVVAYKLAKEKVNIHDRLLFVKAETGSGKTTVFPVELFRSMFTKNLAQFGEAEDEKASFRQMLPSNFSIFDFPDDKYTVANRKKGIQQVSKKQFYIGCTQPKTLTAVEKAKENAESSDYNPDIELGVNTGYATGNFKKRFSNIAGILYMTLGNFFQQLKAIDASERLMSKYVCIMIDECHERMLDLDGSVCYLRNLLRENAGNPSFPLIIFMSATFDLPKFASYFDTPKENAVYVVGESAKKTITYLETPTLNYMTAIAEKVMDIHKNNMDDPPNERDILIFVHGSPDDREIAEAIRRLDTNKEFVILTINSKNYSSQPELIDLLSRMTIAEAGKTVKQPNAFRRVSISTPVAETGLTIPTLKYVIDSGWEKAPYYSPTHNLPFLITKPVTQSSAIQRFGRVGRKFYGYAFGMYTEADFAKFEEYKAPDIYTNDLTKTLLEVMFANLNMQDESSRANRNLSESEFSKFRSKCLGECITGTPSECNFIFNTVKDDKPFIDSALQHTDQLSNGDSPPEMLDKITQDMYIVGRNKIIACGFYGNYIGYIASRIPRLSIESIRMILASFAYGASFNDMVNIAIILEAKSNMYLYGRMDEEMSKGKNTQFSIYRLLKEIISDEIARKHYFGDVRNFVEIFYDDFLRALAILRYVVSSLKSSGPTKTREKCGKLGINYNGLMLILDSRKSITDAFRQFGFVEQVKELDFNDEQIVNEVCRIKKCIYAGYKNNIGYLKDGNYETSTGIQFSVPIFTHRKPKTLIYNSLISMSKRKSVLYDVKADSVCSLDGII